ncbi:hypothetical protein [Ralstonia sp. GP101]|uniref:hypothetical protein n=1 Tax=Ralstonia sp. GP101 TaxID=3035146 RepID=UPI00389241D2
MLLGLLSCVVSPDAPGSLLKLAATAPRCLFRNRHRAILREQDDLAGGIRHHRRKCCPIAALDAAQGVGAILAIENEAIEPDGHQHAAGLGKVGD